jgi:hypothetical protein
MEDTGLAATIPVGLCHSWIVRGLRAGLPIRLVAGPPRHIGCKPRARSSCGPLMLTKNRPENYTKVWVAILATMEQAGGPLPSHCGVG